MDPCTRKSAGAEACPVCGQVGRRVTDATIRAMLDPAHVERLLCVERRFCRTPTCDILYYGPDGRSVRKREARVRVGLKETQEEAQVLSRLRNFTAQPPVFRTA
jgi:CopZ-like zinc binding protein